MTASGSNNDGYCYVSSVKTTSGDKTILQNMYLDFPSSAVTAILGPSGSGYVIYVTIFISLHFALCCVWLGWSQEVHQYETLATVIIVAAVSWQKMNTPGGFLVVDVCLEQNEFSSIACIFLCAFFASLFKLIVQKNDPVECHYRFDSNQRESLRRMYVILYSLPSVPK